MAPKSFKKTDSEHEEAYVRVPASLWREMCVATTRYAYARSQHPQPQRFDAAIDAGIEEEHNAALAASSLVVQ